MTSPPITITLRQVAKHHLAQGELTASLKLCAARRAFLRGDDEAGAEHLDDYHRHTGKLIAVRLEAAA
ncbi:hypothetical protein [Albibacillus kandeliae]|uniref:hypothetical protein n=1 Tax=Albibacillus kandeliae TaxID=2174228 RepID=UPI000D689344|nr:hypothetical protein [Albibacillus kandeliae]